MSIGEKRHRIAFERAQVRRDDYGEADTDYVEICTSWALVQPLKGGERFGANQVEADVDHRIVTRNRSELDGLTPGDRIVWGKVAFDIKAIMFRDHRASELEILAQRHY